MLMVLLIPYYSINRVIELDINEFVIVVQIMFIGKYLKNHFYNKPNYK